MDSASSPEPAFAQPRFAPVAPRPARTPHTPAQALLDQLSIDAKLSGFGVDLPRITRLTETGDRAVQVLSRAILAEPFVAQKVIRAANVVRDLSNNAQVTTLSKAIVVLGLEQVRELIRSTLAVDRLKNPQQAMRVREECSQAVYAAMLARELATGRPGIDPEEAAVCTLFRSYGRVMASVYLYQPYERALALAREPGADPSAIVVQTLGMGFVPFTVEALLRCGMPERIVQAAHYCPPQIRPSSNLLVNLRTIAEFCVEMVDTLREAQPAARHQRVESLLDRFANALGIVRRRLIEALRLTDDEMRELNRLTGPARTPESARPSRSISPLTLSPTNRPGAALTLGAGVASLARMLERNEAPELRMKHALDVLQRAYDFQRVILCLKDPFTGVYRTRMVSGRMPETEEAMFGLREIGQHDLFNAAVLKGADVFIRDATDSKLQAKLPAWFKLTCPDAKSFLLLSIVEEDDPLGFFYADHGRTNDTALGADEIQFIKALKQQTALAVRQERSRAGSLA